MLLRLTLFLCGAVVMSIEILASRILAPEFGDTLFVWGSLIGSFIGALSIGYWVGGVAADRWPTRLVLGGIIAASGILLTIMVPFTRAINGAIYDMSATGSTSYWLKPLLACTAIYFVPVMLLGAVSPFCVRLAAHDLTRLGKKVGGFYAISSFGSILGTFLTAFYLVGLESGVRATIAAEGLLLVALSIPLYVAGFFFEEGAADKPVPPV